MSIYLRIVQRSGLGPTLYIIMESDLKALSKNNLYEIFYSPEEYW